MLFTTRSFTIVSLVFIAAASALPTPPVVEREAGSVRDWKPEIKLGQVIADFKREAGSVRDWKREAGSVRDWKREAGSVRDW